MQRCSLMFWISILLIQSAAEAQESLIIFTENFPPYNYQDEQKITGINVELIRLLCAKAGISCTFHIYPWNRSYKNTLDTQNAGLISTSRHPEREMYFKWVGPIVSSSQRACLYKLKSRTDIVDISKDTLKHYTIAVNRNDIYHRIFSQWGLTENRNFLFYANKQDGIEAFKRRQLDLLMGSPMTLGHHLKQAQMKVDDIEPVFHIQDPMLKGNYLALNRSVSDDLAVALDNALQSLNEEKIKSLISRFVPPLQSKHADSNLANICF